MAYINKETLDIFDMVPELVLEEDAAGESWLYVDDIVAEIAVQLLNKGYPVCGASGSVYNLLDADTFDSESGVDAFFKTTSNIGCVTPYEKVIEIQPGGKKYYALNIYPTAGVNIQLSGCLDIAKYFSDEADIDVHCEDYNDVREDNPQFRYTVISAAVHGKTWAERLQCLVKLISKLLSIIRMMPVLEA